MRPRLDGIHGPQRLFDGFVDQRAPILPVVLGAATGDRVARPGAADAARTRGRPRPGHDGVEPARVLQREEGLEFRTVDRHRHADRAQLLLHQDRRALATAAGTRQDHGELESTSAAPADAIRSLLVPTEGVEQGLGDPPIEGDLLQRRVRRVLGARERAEGRQRERVEDGAHDGASVHRSGDGVPHRLVAEQRVRLGRVARIAAVEGHERVVEPRSGDDPEMRFSRHRGELRRRERVPDVGVPRPHAGETRRGLGRDAEEHPVEAWAPPVMITDASEFESHARIPAHEPEATAAHRRVRRGTRAETTTRDLAEDVHRQRHDERRRVELLG